MRIPCPALLFGLVLAFGSSSVAAESPLRITEPACEYAANPLGVDTAAPRFTWTLNTEERDQRQSAYRVIVASTPLAIRIPSRYECSP